MNRQIRHVWLLVMVMFTTLSVSLTSIQAFDRPALWQSRSEYGNLVTDGRNSRTIYREYGHSRGPIVVAGTPIASSVPTDDAYGYQREYANGPLYAPVTGYFSTVFSSITGLERTENTILNGTAPSLFASRLQALITGTQPQGGAVELTIDPGIQQVAYDALDGREGAVVALDPHTGAILAMVTSPSFDPNAIASHDAQTAQDAWNTDNADPAQPLVNRAISGDLYPPGSTFKILTTAAALRTGKFTPTSEVNAPDALTLPGTNHDLINYAGEACGNGVVSLSYAFAQSCNTPFAQMAMDLGQEELSREAHGWGFDEALSVPLTVTPSTFPDNSAPSEVAMAGIGQQSVRATPLMMAMVAATVANNGVQMRPYLVARTMDADLNVLSTTDPMVLRTPVTPEVAQDLRSMMGEVVSSGTGTNAKVTGAHVWGKTGTAETGHAEGGPTVWFVGFAGRSEDNPTIALAVVLDGGAQIPDGATGGTLAAPIAAHIIDEAVNR
ncbi:peptidoglycan D,D-transpeptidase FtsI family protein [Actinomyces vulturis]|uniref:peptidoglycan D,D-transpeptidase FtsI family protein n=1 Tax=Actinomyces vulturis TaxID=1857645 RepID=UPI0008304512|nr:penicillin-binding protein 2 [Actinomyces vulturis]